MKHDKEHHRLVNSFLKIEQERNPEKYEELSRNHPTLSPDQWKHVHRKEDAIGLIGLEPVKLPAHVAFDNDLEMEIDDE